jgi:PiT family inorganic phosphate transporter
MPLDPLVTLLIALALLFGFLNGFHDSANLVAAIISSRALRPRVALLVAGISVFAGPFLFGTAVAHTVGADLLEVELLSTRVVVAALVGSLLWNLLTWYWGIPSSSSHALIGGLLGTSALAHGFGSIHIPALTTVLLALLLSPFLGLVVGFLLLKVARLLLRGASPGVNTYLRRAQVLTLVGLGLSHGTNDGQKTIAVLTLGLVTAGLLDSFVIPLWVIALSAGALSLGISLGGWRLIRTLGGRLYQIRPIHGLVAQLAGAGVILGAAALGGPVSTTQVISSAISGAGAGQRVGQVRWTVLREMAWAWALTIPTTALLAGLVYVGLTAL